MAHAFLRLLDLSKHYGGVRAVEALSLDIRAGEVFALLGPSGCGKTTTLRIIAGLEVPDAGEILHRDRPLVSVPRRQFVPPEKRRLGMVFQSYAVWPHMTVFENVAYPLRLRGLRGAALREKVARTLDIVGLGGLEARPAPHLFGGQQQRVALARALVYEPEILLLDEPLSNLDAKLREQMRVELKLLQRQLGITMIFVTHDQMEALSLADRLAVMNQGRIEQLGTPRELYERPQTPFVRDFLGQCVVLRGQVGEPSGTLGRVVLGEAAGELFYDQGAAPAAAAVGAPVLVSVRPEDVEVPAARSIATSATRRSPRSAGSSRTSSWRPPTASPSASPSSARRSTATRADRSGSKRTRSSPRWRGASGSGRFRTRSSSTRRWTSPGRSTARSRRPCSRYRSTLASSGPPGPRRSWSACPAGRSNNPADGATPSRRFLRRHDEHIPSRLAIQQPSSSWGCPPVEGAVRRIDGALPTALWPPSTPPPDRIESWRQTPPAHWRARDEVFPVPYGEPGPRSILPGLRCPRARLTLACQKCGTGLPGGAHFYLRCGEPVGAEPPGPPRFALSAPIPPSTSRREDPYLPERARRRA